MRVLTDNRLFISFFWFLKRNVEIRKPQCKQRQLKEKNDDDDGDRRTRRDTFLPSHAHESNAISFICSRSFLAGFGGQEKKEKSSEMCAKKRERNQIFPKLLPIDKALNVLTIGRSLKTFQPKTDIFWAKKENEFPFFDPMCPDRRKQIMREIRRPTVTTFTSKVGNYFPFSLNIFDHH